MFAAPPVAAAAGDAACAPVLEDSFPTWHLHHPPTTTSTSTRTGNMSSVVDSNPSGHSVAVVAGVKVVEAVAVVAARAAEIRCFGVVRFGTDC